MTNLSRRSVLAGSGLIVSFSLRAWAQEGGSTEAPVAAGLPGSLKSVPLLDSWIAIAADGSITVFTGKVELGQGAKTAFIQLAAEELVVPPAAIELVTADTGRTPNEGLTAGSHSMQDSGVAIRNAAANVRMLLSKAAALHWSLPVSAVKAADGAIVGPGRRRISYAELASTLSLHVEAVPNAPLIERKIQIGRPLPRVDIPAKLTGGAAFVQDMRLPSMVHARVVRGPSENTLLETGDEQAVLAMPGVIKLVRQGHFVSIVAEKEWQAIQAMRRLQRVPWRAMTSLPDEAGISEMLQQSPSQDEVILNKGTLGPAQVKARYTRPYLLHGSIGPSCAVALYKDGLLTVWTHSQGVYPLRGALADLTHIPVEKIRCIHVEGAGCYGHNGADDVAADAALTALALPDRPVRLQWMREQEHGWEPLGPAMVAELSSALDADGKISSWTHDVWSNTHNYRPTSGGGLLAGLEFDPPLTPPPPRSIPMPEGGGDRNAIAIYAFPNAKVISHFIPKMPLRVSALRSLGAQLNIFAIESFMDELASVAHADPVAFRLRHLADPRAIEVVRRAAADFGWGQWKSAPGRGRGFAFARYKNLGAYCAVALEITMDPNGNGYRIGRVVAAVDSGEAINPDGLRNQIEGGIVQSLSWSRFEKMRFDSQHRIGSDWRSYPISRFQNLPEDIAVSVINRDGQPFLGTGEASQGPSSAAIANALANATGRRSRDLPLG